MRSIVNLLFLVSVLAGSVAHARGNALGMPRDDRADEWAESARKTVFKLHPLPAIAGPAFGLFTLPVELEFALHPGFSLYFMGSPVVLVNGAGGGVAVNGGMRGYLSGTAPDGFWLGAQLGVTALDTRFGAATVVDLQPQLGYQWVLGNGFSIGIGAGVSVNQLMAEQFPLTFVLPLGFAW